MISRVEKQSEVHVAFGENTESSALFARYENNQKEGNNKGNFRRKDNCKNAKGIVIMQC